MIEEICSLGLRDEIKEDLLRIRDYLIVIHKLLKEYQTLLDSLKHIVQRRLKEKPEIIRQVFLVKEKNYPVEIVDDEFIRTILCFRPIQIPQEIRKERNEWCIILDTEDEILSFSYSGSNPFLFRFIVSKNKESVIIDGVMTVWREAYNYVVDYFDGFDESDKIKGLLKLYYYYDHVIDFLEETIIYMKDKIAELQSFLIMV